MFGIPGFTAHMHIGREGPKEADMKKAAQNQVSWILVGALSLREIR